MTRRAYLFDSPDRFVAGTVGQPGNRTFFLQAREGDRIASVVLEKVQVAALAHRLGELLEELRRRGVDAPETIAPSDVDERPLDEPLIEAFRAGTLTIGWDPQHERVVLEALAMTEGDEDDDDEDDAEDEDDEDEDEGSFDLLALADGDVDGPDFVRVRLTTAETAAFVERSLRVVAAGRPPCPICGRPLDPQGHLCPRKNGYLN
ncbi:MAG: DUF3090 family protein [Chloroflexi bacterium]|jgi:uncharacterized repeat protein (TIGR03847 family)|nr:DUF3090 family protein [Chloroflexota bacterium]